MPKIGNPEPPPILAAPLLCASLTAIRCIITVRSFCKPRRGCLIKRFADSVAVDAHTDRAGLSQSAALFQLSSPCPSFPAPLLPFRPSSSLPSPSPPRKGHAPWIPLRFPSFPSFSSLPFPYKYDPLNRARVWGSVVSSPQRGLGRSPSRNRIWCILALKYDIWWQQF